MRDPGKDISREEAEEARAFADMADFLMEYLPVWRALEAMRVHRDQPHNSLGWKCWACLHDLLTDVMAEAWTKFCFVDDGSVDWEDIATMDDFFAEAARLRRVYDRRSAERAAAERKGDSGND